MCEICRNVLCPSSCPNYIDKPKKVCTSCNENMYDGEKAYMIENKIYCSDCVNIIFL